MFIISKGSLGVLFATECRQSAHGHSENVRSLAGSARRAPTSTTTAGQPRAHDRTAQHAAGDPVPSQRSGRDVSVTGKSCSGFADTVNPPCCLSPAPRSARTTWSATDARRTGAPRPAGATAWFWANVARPSPTCSTCPRREARRLVEVEDTNAARRDRRASMRRANIVRQLRTSRVPHVQTRERKHLFAPAPWRISLF